MPDAFRPDDLEALYTSLSSYHSEKRTNQQFEDKLYRQDTSWAMQSVPADASIFSSSTATDIIDQLADQIRTDEPTVRYRQNGNNEDARKLKTLMQRWGEQIITYDRLHGEVDPYAQESKDLPLRGEGVLKCLHNPHLPIEPSLAEIGNREAFDHEHEIWEAKMAETNPLLPARAVDPIDIFIPPNASWPFPYLIEYQQRRQLDMWRDYPDWRATLVDNNKRTLGNLGRRGLSEKQLDDPMREVVWLEFWGEDAYTVEANGITVIDKPNPYGIVPYSHRYSGQGRIDTSGSSARKAVGILRKILGEVQGEILMRTLMFAATKYYIFQRLLVPKGQEDYYADRMAAGQVIGYDGTPDSVQWLESPDLNPAVAETLAQTKGQIDRRVNPIQRGLAPGNPQSGIQEAVELTQADTGLLELSAAINQIATQRLIIASRQMKALGLSMNVKGGEREDGKIDPDLIASGARGDFDHPNFDVEFQAVDPIEQTRQQQAGLVLMRERALSRKTYWERHTPDIDGEEEELRINEQDAMDAWKASDEFAIWATQQFMGEEQVGLAEDEAGAQPVQPTPSIEQTNALQADATALTQRTDNGVAENAAAAVEGAELRLP